MDDMVLDAYVDAAHEVVDEVESARKHFGPMRGPHEGYAVILEELDELWEDVRNNKRPDADYRAAMRKEAIQVAAMAIAFIVEVCDEDGEG